MDQSTRCPQCGSTQKKQGKLMGVAALQSMDARAPLFGSEVIATFYADCGHIFSATVKNPENIK